MSIAIRPMNNARTRPGLAAVFVFASFCAAAGKFCSAAAACAARRAAAMKSEVRVELSGSFETIPPSAASDCAIRCAALCGPRGCGAPVPGSSG
jgi:hypothetical protein